MKSIKQIEAERESKKKYAKWQRELRENLPAYSEIVFRLGYDDRELQILLGKVIIIANRYRFPIRYDDRITDEIIDELIVEDFEEKLKEIEEPFGIKTKY